MDFKPYKVRMSDEYYNDIKKKNNIKKFLPIELDSKIINEFSFIVKDMLNIYYINAYLEDKTGYKSIKYLKILIFLNYFLIWLYIIIISLPHLNIHYDSITYLLEALTNSLDNFENNPIMKKNINQLENNDG